MTVEGFRLRGNACDLGGLLEHLEQFTAGLGTGTRPDFAEHVPLAGLSASMAITYGLIEVREQLRFSNLIALAQSAPLDPQSRMIRDVAWRQLVVENRSPGRKTPLLSLHPDLVEALDLEDDTVGGVS